MLCAYFLWAISEQEKAYNAVTNYDARQYVHDVCKETLALVEAGPVTYSSLPQRHWDILEGIRTELKKIGNEILNEIGAGSVWDEKEGLDLRIRFTVSYIHDIHTSAVSETLKSDYAKERLQYQRTQQPSRSTF
ncbi:hypothetical protein V5O48_013200 [Marasmius crinis-equi]|uniref:Uncharacterized protein n=1 Tax=Marasmius crinis-equi TaxID=585013 RepID=A0ABR3F0R0_9AGAR